MTRSRIGTSALLAFFSPILLQGCDNPLPTAPVAAPVSLHRHISPTARSAKLAVCPTRSTASITGTIGPEGGSLRVAGHALTVPAGALSRPTSFTLRAPAGRFVSLEITADGGELYQFAAPVAITISYARCKRQNFSTAEAMAWSLNAETEGPLPSIPDPADRAGMAITFVTDRLPGDIELIIARGIYAVAY